MEDPAAPNDAGPEDGAMPPAPDPATGRRPRVGLVGAGIMGRGIGENLLKKGFPLHVLAHRNRAPVDALRAAGAAEARDLRELAGAADVVVLCLPDADVAADVLERLAPLLPAGRLVIDTGTSRPEVARGFEALLAPGGSLFAEVPVAGGRQQAEAGALGAIVGASPEALERARPVLAAFTATIQHFGPVGTASIAKLVNNYVVMGMAALVTEAFRIAADKGVDWAKLHDVMTRGAGDSGVLRRIGGGAAAGDFRVYAFPVKGAAKDLDYFRRMLAAEGEEPSPLARAVIAAFEREVEAGRGDLLLGELLAPGVRGGGTA